MNKKEATMLLNMLNAGDVDGIRAALVNQLKEVDTKDMLGNKFLSGIKAAKKELKKAGKTRPILSYSHVENDIQYMTDSFWALALKKEYHTDLVENHGGNHGVYPCVESFIPQASNGHAVTVTADDIANAWKPGVNNDKYLVLPYHENYVFLNASYCKMIMQIMGDGARWYTYGPYRPVLIESERGRAVIVPIRMTGAGEKEYNDYIAAQRVGA
jgi:hypothetical protein